MAIPDYQTIMLPILQYLADNQEHKVREVAEHISDKYKLTPEERRELLPSGQQPIIDNRVGWARTYLLKAGLIMAPKRGSIKITEKGIQVLNKKPERIDVKFLEKYPEFVEFRTIKKETTESKDVNEVETEGATPDEMMEKGNNIINANLAQEILNKVRKCDPYFFEQVVGNLLTAMGYGKCEITAGSGDKGVDGIVTQDKLGLDKIFFQAKRYDEKNPVSAHNVRDFVGTLDLHGVSKGIFITTSKFPKDTQEILKKTPKTIILIDGTRLANLMIEHNVGVSTKKVYKIKSIDSDFFPEE